VEQAPAFAPEKVLPEDAAKGRAFAAPRLAQVTLSHEGRQFVSHPSSALVPNASAAMVEAAAAEEATHSTTLARVAPAAAEFKPATGGTALAASSALARAMAGSTQLAEDAAALRPATATGGGASQAQPQVQTAAFDPVPTIAANAAEFRHAIPTQPAAPVNSLRPAVEVPAPFEQVAVQIHRAASLGMDRITIQLKPASLGRIGIQLEVGHDGRVTAVISADRPETLELLQRDARSLERALEQAGLRTDSGSLSFNLNDRNHGDMPSLAEADGSGAADDAAETEVSDEPAVAVTDVIGADIGTDGRIDIRV
jgi:flagellar hook-length control protein FliK